MVGVTKAAGYSWLKRWNSSGYEGLIPEFGGGRHSKLTEDQKEELREIKERDSWTTKEVQELIEEEFGVKYSSWQENSKIVCEVRPIKNWKPEKAEESLKLRDGAPCYARET